MQRRPLLCLAAASAAALALTSCFEIDQKITLNSDGSGKVEQKIITSMNPGALLGFAEEDDKPDAGESAALMDGMTAELTKNVLEQSEGFDAWSQPESKTLGDGRFQVTITGYFPDVNKAKMENSLSMNSSGSEEEEDEEDEEKDGDDAEPADLTPLLKYSRSGDTATITAVEPEPAADKTDTGGSGYVRTEEEARAMLQEKRAEWQMGKTFMSAIMGSLKVKTTVVAPGEITKAEGFTKTGPSEAAFEISGPEIIGAMDKAIHDDDLATESLRKGDDIVEGLDEKTLAGYLFGGDSAAVPNFDINVADTPTFDYAAEVEAAKANPARPDADDEDEGAEEAGDEAAE